MFSVAEKERHAVYSCSPYIVKVMNWRRQNWVGHVIRGREIWSEWSRLGADPGPCSLDAPRPYERTLCAPLLVSPVISRGTPRPATWGTSISERRKYGRETADPILPTACDFHGKCRDVLRAANLRHGTDGFTSAPTEGMLRMFFARKIRRFQPGLNPRTWVPEASMLTTRPLKPLVKEEVEVYFRS
jgi:hypothetical protein